MRLGTDGSTIKLARERKSLAARTARRTPYMVRQHDLVLTFSFSLGHLWRCSETYCVAFFSHFMFVNHERAAKLHPPGSDLKQERSLGMTLRPATSQMV